LTTPFKAYPLELALPGSFRASHSLPGRPELHAHDWQVEWILSGNMNPETAMVADLLDLHRVLQPLLARLEGTNLHQSLAGDPGDALATLASRFPTCEALACLLERTSKGVLAAEPGLAGLRLLSVAVRLAEPGAELSWGWARVRCQE
jgi:6-pyruvoyl-tetrahydropterin synthase